MTDDVKTRLKEQAKLTKKHYKYSNMKSNLDKVIAKSNECVRKDKHIKQICQALNDPQTFKTFKSRSE